MRIIALSILCISFSCWSVLMYAPGRNQFGHTGYYPSMMSSLLLHDWQAIQDEDRENMERWNARAKARAIAVAGVVVHSSQSAESVENGSFSVPAKTIETDVNVDLRLPLSPIGSNR